MWSRMSKGEREERKEGRGQGRSGRAWWAEERIWAFTPREVEQDHVACGDLDTGGKGPGRRLCPVRCWQEYSHKPLEMVKQPGSIFVNFCVCGKMRITY